MGQILISKWPILKIYNTRNLDGEWESCTPLSVETVTGFKIPVTWKTKALEPFPWDMFWTKKTTLKSFFSYIFYHYGVMAPLENDPILLGMSIQ